MSYKMEFREIEINSILKVTEKAVLVELESPDGDELRLWIPRSNLSTPDDKKIDTNEEVFKLSVTKWFLQEKGL